MRKALVTGANGTVGRALSRAIAEHGGQAIAYDLQAGPPDNYGAMEQYVRAVNPDAIFHLAIASQHRAGSFSPEAINSHWPHELAWLTGQLGIPFVFTSTAMVFTDQAKGPFSPDSLPDATEGYGGEKAAAERVVRRQNPQARVVRLGWQIGRDYSGNQMAAWMETQQREQGVVRASRLWIPACSFLEDTAEALLEAIRLPPGIYHLDGNGNNDSFHAIACALSAEHHDRWTVEADDAFVYNQRLLDDRLKCGPIRSRLRAFPKP